MIPAHAQQLHLTYLRVAILTFYGHSIRARLTNNYIHVIVSSVDLFDLSLPTDQVNRLAYQDIRYTINIYFDTAGLYTIRVVLSTPTNDLWNFTLADGRGIRKALEYMAPFLEDKSTWPLAPDIQACTYITPTVCF